jgi:hypothetical protein
MIRNPPEAVQPQRAGIVVSIYVQVRIKFVFFLSSEIGDNFCVEPAGKALIGLRSN